MNGLWGASRPRVIAAGWMVGLSAVSACGSQDDQRTETITPDVLEEARAGLTPELRAELDSGNVAMRAGDPATALGHYRRATELDPESAAAWFGVYMGARALGNAEEAERALDRARAVAPEASLLGADTVSESDPAGPAPR